MRDHDPAVRNFRRDLAEPSSDVFVGQAVKAVAANALHIERVGIAKRSATSGWPRWKAVSKHATCGSCGCRCRIADRRQVVRLMQGASGRNARAGRPLVADNRRRAVVGAAVNDPVADDDRQFAADLRAQKPDDLVKAAGTVFTSAASQVSSTSNSPSGSFAIRCGCVPMPSTCPLKRRLSRSRAPTSNNWNLMLELPAFTTRMVSAAMAQPRTGSFALRL